ncbi:MAG: S9 family peptidase [Candidatus Heimdallarchaeota archaeon]|nr:S9 family peptidase [Candidatus Heimdallarchaeota archaeon]
MEKKKFELDDLFSFKRVMTTKILPEKTILFEEQTMNQKENKYNSAIYTIMDQEPIQFTSGLSQDKSMKLSPQKDRIAFLSARGGDKAKPQIFIMPVAGGEALRYTNMKDGVGEFNWSLDGTKVVFTHRVNLEEQEDENKKDDEKKEKLSDLDAKIKNLKEQEKEQEKLDPRVISKIVYRKGTNFLDDRLSHVYILDLDSKETTRITSGSLNYLSPFIGSNNEKIFAVKPQEKGQLNDLYEFEILEIDIESKEEKVLRVATGFGSAISLSPDGRWLVYNTLINVEFPSTENSHLKLYNTSTGLEKWVSETIDNHSFSPIFDAESTYLYFISDEWERNTVYRFNIERETLEKIYGGDSLINSYDVDSTQGIIAISVSTKENISILQTYDFVYKELKTLWKSNEEFLKEKVIAETEEIRYKGHDDVEIQGWIVKPPGFDKSKKYPLILEMHGGPHATWSPYEISMWFEYQYFASQGYVIFYCNPQGSSGRGYDFRYIIKNWGTKPEQDILKGVDQVIERGYTDKENLFITGGSYGGYMTAWIIGHDTRFKAAVPQRGVYNCVSFWGTTDVTQLMKNELGAYPWEDMKSLWDLSPIAYVDKVKTPTRIIHSETDFRVPIHQGEEYFSSLLKVGVEAELIRYPEEGHELSRSGKPKHVKDRLAKIVEWFNKYKTE